MRDIKTERTKYSFSEYGRINVLGEMGIEIVFNILLLTTFADPCARQCKPN